MFWWLNLGLKGLSRFKTFFYHKVCSKRLAGYWICDSIFGQKLNQIADKPSHFIILYRVYTDLWFIFLYLSCHLSCFGIFTRLIDGSSLLSFSPVVTVNSCYKNLLYVIITVLWNW